MGEREVFSKMTPSDEINMTVYEEALKYVFENGDIRNIAISGVYGAGKSSMIESYKKTHPEKKFIHVSLARFDLHSDEAAEDKNKVYREAGLEGKIINQVIHQIDPQSIPLTKFKIKEDINTKHILRISLLVTAFIVILCFLKFQDTWKNVIQQFSDGALKESLRFTTTGEMQFVMGVLAVIILGKAVYEVIKFQKSDRLLKKLIFKGGEVEVFEATNDSYFDKYLNEVLYIFKRASVDGIIFEDIDRYDTGVIFEKLREINFLLNQKGGTSDKQGSDRVIRFFYLLRDDIFETKDRTKFFDFILPVLPAVGASSAYKNVKEYFGRTEVESETGERRTLLSFFNEEFLRELFFYVDDMRVLKNICNEFIIYHELLRVTPQDYDKLLAIIVYKNLFPKDFSCLQVERGYVHTLFARKKQLLREKTEKIRRKIRDLEEENIAMSQELHRDVDELNAVYFMLEGEIMVDGKKENEYRTRKEFVEAVLRSGNVVRYDYASGGWRRIRIEEQKHAMERNEEYAERKRLIKKRTEDQQNENNKRINELKKQIEELNHMCLRELITDEDETAIFKIDHVNELDEVEKFADVKRSPHFGLIKMLIRKGYLDETYPKYMACSYENSISADGKTYRIVLKRNHAG